MMCKQTVCIKWWVAVIVGFLGDTAKPCPTSAEGATLLRGVPGILQNFEKSKQNGGIWRCLWHYLAIKIKWRNAQCVVKNTLKYVYLLNHIHADSFSNMPCVRSCVFTYMELRHWQGIDTSRDSMTFVNTCINSSKTMKKRSLWRQTYRPTIV